MNTLQSYWLAIKRGEDFDKFSNEELPQVWLFNYVGIIFNWLMFWWLDIILEWVFFVVMLFYIYRWYCFRRYSLSQELKFDLNKKKRS